MKAVFLIVFGLFSTLLTMAQTFSWSGYTTGSMTYTSGILTATVTSTSPGFQNSTPRHYAAATVGSGQCGIAGGLALEHLFGNITNAHSTLVLDFTSGGGSNGTCSNITFQIRDINSDESVQTFADWVEISAIDGNNAQVPVANITASGGSNKTISTSGNTRIIRGYSGTYGSRGTTACDNVNIAVNTPAGVPLKSITIKYHPDYTPSPNYYYNFSGPLRPAYQYISIGSITATPVGGCIVLPVELSSFEAERVEKEVELNWVTETELDNDYFVLERTTDGEKYESVVVINGKESSSSTSYYSFVDENSSAEVTYYRLKQVDLNGRPTYHDLVAVDGYKEDISVLNAHPNPTSDRVSYTVLVPYDQMIRTVVTDINGRIVLEESTLYEKGIQRLALDLTNLKEGMYQLSVVTEDGKMQTSLVSKID